MKDRELSPARQFRSGYRELLLLAKSELVPSQFSEYLEWVKEQTTSQLSELASEPIGYDELSGLITATPTSLEIELEWITARIRVEHDKIKAFRLIVGEVETL
ncbi:hypothetical protein FV218_07035 [Methylobacterium sp. WL69]|uniref:hypothetical protein n=1 Tax=Methylobacterium sp. WL69 TaxID=2603893 RepID=UPI0011CBB8C3|nr:hypothetical protein [Methylobacterium sp. WL69]TXM76509.1 hypothetical protein FV218_07035 [Methylobacterium sp. WL69]